MVTFLEYFKGNPIMNGRMHNGKDPYTDPSTRVHGNAVKQEFKHKHPIINSIASSRANNVSLAGIPLQTLLQAYKMSFEPGIKTIGNSNVEIEMQVDEKGTPTAILRQKQ